MFYSVHDNVLPFQLVSIGFIMPKTKQPTKHHWESCAGCAEVSLEGFGSMIYFFLATIFLL